MQEVSDDTVDIKQSGLVQELLQDRGVLDTMQKVVRDENIAPLSWMMLEFVQSLRSIVRPLELVQNTLSNSL